MVVAVVLTATRATHQPSPVCLSRPTNGVADLRKLTPR
jgi:hypothetical protein